MKCNKRRGFTLIELIIVIVIIGILASIAAPMMSGMQKKAIAAEAIAVLGTIRSAEQAYYVEHEHYADLRDLNFSLRPDFEAGKSDLDGVYFSQECYTWFSFHEEWNGPHTYLVGCAWPAGGIVNTAPKHDIPDRWAYSGGSYAYIVMDESGHIYSDVDGLGYEHNSYCE